MEAVFFTHREALHDQLVELWAHLGVELGGLALDPIHDEVSHLPVALRLEDRLAGQRFPQHDGSGVDVRTTVDLAVGPELFGRHVAQAPLELVVACVLQPPRCLGDAEVQDLRHPIDAHLDVLGRHVPVNEVDVLAAVVASLVRGMEPVQDAGHDGEQHVLWNSLLGLACSDDQLRQRFAVHVLHDQQQLAFERHDVEHGHHVGVTDACRETRLVDEHGDELGVPREVRVKPLDRDRTRESGQPEQSSEMHVRHPARGDDPVQGVPTNDPIRGIGASIPHQCRSVAKSGGQSRADSLLANRALTPPNGGNWLRSTRPYREHAGANGAMSCRVAAEPRRPCRRAPARAACPAPATRQ